MYKKHSLFCFQHNFYKKNVSYTRRYVFIFTTIFPSIIRITKYDL